MSLILAGDDDFHTREAASATIREYAASSEARWFQVRNLAHGQEVIDPEVRHRLKCAYIPHTAKIIDSLLPADAVLWPDIDRLMGNQPQYKDHREPTQDEIDALAAWMQEMNDLRERYVIRESGTPAFFDLYPDYRVGMRHWALEQLGSCGKPEHLDHLRRKIAAAVERDKLRTPTHAVEKNTDEYRARIAKINKLYPGIVNPRYLK